MRHPLQTPHSGYHWDGSDHYFKGAWILHTLRHAIGADEQWWPIFKGFYQEYKLSLIDTEDFVNYVNEQTGQDWTAFFDQYLRYAQPPRLEYELEEKGKNLRVRYRWVADVDDFAMPVIVGNGDKEVRITPNTREWQETVLFRTAASDFEVAQDRFLVKTKRIRS